MSMLCLKKEESWKFTCDGCGESIKTTGEKRDLPNGWVELFLGDVHVECQRFVITSKPAVDTSGSGAVFGGNAYNNREQCYYSHDDNLLHACSEACLNTAWQKKGKVLLDRIRNLRQ